MLPHILFRVKPKQLMWANCKSNCDRAATAYRDKRKRETAPERQSEMERGNLFLAAALGRLLYFVFIIIVRQTFYYKLIGKYKQTDKLTNNSDKLEKRA